MNNNEYDILVDWSQIMVYSEAHTVRHLQNSISGILTTCMHLQGFAYYGLQI